MGAFMKTIILAAGLAVLFGAPAAGTADLYVPQPEPYVEPAPVVQASGWYLRGDVSYDFSDIDGAHYFPGGARTDFTSADLDDSYNLGLGVGYQINSYLRTDLTADYMFKTDFEGSTAGVCPGGGPCASQEESSVSLLSLLANAYVDLGTYSGITPYVGAGIGGAHIKWDDVRDPNTTEFNPGAKNWRFAYALMAGASYCLTDHAKLDVGYRYSHINGGKMFEYASDSNVGPGYDRGINVHEVRGGLRYQFGGQSDCAPPPEPYVPQPEPIYTK